MDEPLRPTFFVHLRRNAPDGWVEVFQRTYRTKAEANAAIAYLVGLGGYTVIVKRANL